MPSSLLLLASFVWAAAAGPSPRSAGPVTVTVPEGSPLEDVTDQAREGIEKAWTDPKIPKPQVVYAGLLPGTNEMFQVMNMAMSVDRNDFENILRGYRNAVRKNKISLREDGPGKTCHGIAHCLSYDDPSIKAHRTSVLFVTGQGVVIFDQYRPLDLAKPTIETDEALKMLSFSSPVLSPYGLKRRRDLAFELGELVGGLIGAVFIVLVLYGFARGIKGLFRKPATPAPPGGEPPSREVP